MAGRMAEHNITLTASDAALEQLSSEGYNPEMGARPLRRVIQEKVEDSLSDAVLSREFSDGDAVLVDVDKEGKIILKRNRKRASALKTGKTDSGEKQPEEEQEVAV